MPGAQSVRTLTTIQRIQHTHLHTTGTANCTNLKTVFQYIMPFDLVETNQHFTAAYCPQHQGDELMMEAASTSVTCQFIPDYMAQNPIRAIFILASIRT
jgi:hypothetical protein